MEIGQPTHAFDGDKVEAIRVATFQKKGTFITLDDQPRELLPEDLLIWNGDQPVALAGIMGGAETEVSAATRKVLLESANFKASRIRNTSVRLDLRTDASQRYEKSQPPVNVLTGVQRIMHLLEEAKADFKVTSRFTLEGDLDDRPREIVLPSGALPRLSGIELSREQVLSILQSIEFDASYDAEGGLRVNIPPFRSRRDVGIGPDIIEEVLRIYGYDHIPPAMPALPLQPLQVEIPLRLQHKARRLLSSGHRFLEVQQYGWMNDQWLERIGFEPANALRLRNPAALPDNRLRTTLMPNLLALIPKNRNHSDRFRLFELGNIYLPEKNGCREKPMLAGVSYQQGNQPSLEEHYRAIKGALEDFPRMLKETEFQFVASEEKVSPWQIPGLWAEIRQGDTMVGGIGTADDSLMQVLAPDGGQVIWFELDFEAIQGKLYPEVQFERPPRYPRSWQDFSLLWDIGEGFEKLQKRLDRFQHPLIRRREFLTAYKGKGLEKGMASYSFRFWIGAEDHTLTGEEIEQFHDSFLAFLKNEKIALR
jgi:phenylalanyl-tRNA synthetase beta chain